MSTRRVGSKILDKFKEEDENEECLIHRVVKYVPNEIAIPIFDVLIEHSSDFLLLKDRTGSVPLHHAMDNSDMNSDLLFWKKTYQLENTINFLILF